MQGVNRIPAALASEILANLRHVGSLDASFGVATRCLVSGTIQSEKLGHAVVSAGGVAAIGHERMTGNERGVR